MFQRPHNNIVRILDDPESDKGDCGYHYFVMEYVAGGTFLEAVTSGALSLEERIDVVLQIADALAFAHEHGNLHRDVKPENILLDAGGGPAKLTDFDLVFAADTWGGTQNSLGTLCYGGWNAWSWPTRSMRGATSTRSA